LPTIDAIIFVTEPPVFDIRDGLVHITQKIGEATTIERVMLLSTFIETIAMAQKALRDYERSGTARVIAFPTKAGNGH